MNDKKYLAAMYLRLSREDEDIDGNQKTESNSIGTQRDLVRAFIKNNSDMELHDIYIDDGYTGSNFEHPEFKRMIADIEAGKVNCVVVKDLSRFGREYIEAGRFLQKTFPALGVRFIAITDNYDSLKADNSDSSIILPVKNFINDSFCRDISIKVKSQQQIKRQIGECIAPFVVFGYLKNPKDNHKLIIDEYAAEVVRNIFKWKIDGNSSLAIAIKLNEHGVLSPLEYKKFIGINYNTGFVTGTKSKWSSVAVTRILKNETYMGTMIQGKSEKVNYKVKKLVNKPANEWIKVEETHEAIISKEDFNRVRNLLMTDTRNSPDDNEDNSFKGIVKATNSVLEKIKIENVTHVKVTSTKRIEKNLVEPVAMREAIVNCIIHNDFSREIPPVFEMFSDRIVMTSYGGLIPGQSEEDFFSCSSMPRNRELMRVFKDVGLVEQLGSGMSRILKAYNKDVFQISNHFIKAVFPFAEALVMENTASGGINGSKSGGINGSNEAYSVRVMVLMKEIPDITLNDLGNRLGLSTRKISRIIKELRESGKVTRTGSTRKGTWHINE